MLTATLPVTALRYESPLPWEVTHPPTHSQRLAETRYKRLASSLQGFMF